MINQGSAWIPHTPGDEARLAKYGRGSIVRFTKATKPRSGPFHRKFFALLGVFFDAWEPTEGAKDFEQFRQWCLIKIGHHDVIGYPDGSVRLRAKSISYGAIPDDDDFGRLIYSPTIDLALKFLTTYSKEDLENRIDQIVSFL